MTMNTTLATSMKSLLKLPSKYMYTSFFFYSKEIEYESKIDRND